MRDGAKTLDYKNLPRSRVLQEFVWFDKPLLSIAERLTTIGQHPLALSLSKGVLDMVITPLAGFVA